MNAIAKMVEQTKMMPMSSNMGMSSLMNSVMCTMASLSFTMEENSVTCEMKPMNGVNIDCLDGCCDMINQMCEMGIPVVLTCCNISVAVTMSCEMKSTSMMCHLVPMKGMTHEMMCCCCNALSQLCNMGMPITVNCCNMTMMVCCSAEKC